MKALISRFAAETFLACRNEGLDAFQSRIPGVGKFRSPRLDLATTGMSPRVFALDVAPSPIEVRVGIAFINGDVGSFIVRHMRRSLSAADIWFTPWIRVRAESSEIGTLSRSRHPRAALIVLFNAT